MMRHIKPVAILAMCGMAVAIATATGEAHSQALYPDRLEWPQPDPYAIPDARLRDVLASAKEDARKAASEAHAGGRAAGQARRITGLRNAIGRGPQPQIIGDGVVMSAVPYGDDGGTMFGELAWANGGKFVGVVSSAIGEYVPPTESALARFSGWVFGPAQSAPTPMTGEFEFKNGERFTGSFNAGSNASGIYVSADGERRFVGTIDFLAGSYRPMKGQLEDRRGRLLAVVDVREP